MNATPNRDKWVHQIRFDDSVVTAARMTLKSRLVTVEHLLRLSAHHSDETCEYVHQVRVSTRRSQAALRMYDAVLPKKETKWLWKRLKRIRKATGEARDLDVFLQRYQTLANPDHARFLDRVTKRRRKAQRPIVKLHQKLNANHQYEQQVQHLLKMIAWNSAPYERSLECWARSRLAKATEKFFATAPQHAPPSIKELHRFRIQGKELRYAMELFATLLPPELRTSVYPLVTRMQDRLGKLCDHASACRQLAKWRDESSPGPEAKHLLMLEGQERAELQEAIGEFAKWWTPESADKLQRSLCKITDPDAVVASKRRETD